MPSIVQRFASSMLITAASATIGMAQAEPPEGFARLGNTTDLTGWWGFETEDPRQVYGVTEQALDARQEASRVELAKHWRNNDGVFINDGGGLYLTTNDLYGDFELLLEYKTVAGADSGIYLRGIPQVQIWDTTEVGGKWNIGADKGSGGLWNNSAGNAGKDPLVHADAPFGEWNRVRVLMVGERVSVWLNGHLVVCHARLENYFDRSLPVPREGPIQLQTHGGEVQWRDIFIREIGPEEANEILATHGGAAFASAFNGETFEGWAGATENYEIVDGAIRCMPGHGGNIFTEDEYSDFVVRFEFKLPPGGNNGLAIRYPGSGDAAYDAMCELQVLDNTHPKYNGLDPRQYHGSAYAQAPAHRGYLREPGEWNFQEVTVDGSRITVELNGTRILDTDFHDITDFMYDAERFKGRDRTSGHFGFCGHNDPVEFRAISIQRLED